MNQLRAIKRGVWVPQITGILIVVVLIVGSAKSASIRASAADSTDQIVGGVFSFQVTALDIDTLSNVFSSTYFNLAVFTQGPVPFKGFLLTQETPLSDTMHSETFNANPIYTNSDNRVIDHYDQDFTISRDPTKGQSPVIWSLVPQRPLSQVGSPWDTFSLYFLIGVNIIFHFSSNITTPITLPLGLRDSWNYSLTLSSVPTTVSNQTVHSWGIDPGSFVYDVRTMNVKSLYLISLTFFRTDLDKTTTFLTFILPSPLLVSLSIFSIALVRTRRLDVPSALSVFAGTAFFALPFLVTAHQSNFEGVVSIQELLLTFAFLSSFALALVTLLLARRPPRRGESFAAA